jgi:predicted nuclease of predicted toxin-antitoxin system
MNLVADESVDKPIVDRLRDCGHTIWYVTEMSPSISDHSVLELANNQKTPLLTCDRDFGELVFRQGLVSIVNGHLKSGHRWALQNRPLGGRLNDI